MPALADQAEGLRLLVAEHSRRAPGTANANGRAIAIASGKGGVGKTNLTVNLAVALAQSGKSIAIYDADMGLANADLLMGLAPDRRLDGVANSEVNLEEIIVTGPEGVLLVPGASGAAVLADAGDGLRKRMVLATDTLRQRCDFTLVDTAAGVSSGVVDFIVAAGEAIVVTTTEPTALADAYALIKVASRTDRRVAYRLVVNQADSGVEAVAVGRRLADTARRFLGVDVSLWDYIPRDQDVPRAVKGRVPMVLAYPQAPASRAFRALARTLGAYRSGRGV